MYATIVSTMMLSSAAKSTETAGLTYVMAVEIVKEILNIRLNVLIYY